MLLTFMGKESCAQSVLTNGLVAYYPFAGNPEDASGQGRHGTAKGVVLTEDRFGQTKQAYYFNGADAYIEGSASGFPEADRTISAWFKTEAGAGDGPFLLAYGGGSGGTSFLMAIDSSCTGGGAFNYSVWPHGTAYNVVVPIASREDGRWTHWVVTIEKGKVTSYVDGSQVGVADVGFPSTQTEGTLFEIGVPITTEGNGPYNPVSCGTFFKGVLDDLRVYNRALSASEVRVLNQIESRPLKTVSIRVTRVMVEATVTPGKCYQLERSAALGNWLPVGGPRRASGSFFAEEAVVDASAQYFRVLEVNDCP
ncbi:MAG: LamG domain-containing protein [Verrucomicrobiales bacterium]|nr:LamG domain-containing protein [Verrucomicrobiales bacterium]